MSWKVALTGLYLLVLTGAVAAQERSEPDPLFASDELLRATITTQVEQLMDERPVDEYLPGTFSYADNEGRQVEFDIGLRTRGHYRRQVETCRFAPLRVNFKKSQTDDTLFDKQDKLKLVTHCQDGSRTYQQAVVREYLAYRVLNLLTDLSFRARLVEVRYVDTDNPGEGEINYSIFVEDEDRLAKRIGIPKVDIAGIAITDLVPDYASLISIFQYFLGNTDFSQIQTSPGEDCCHNHDLFGLPGEKYYAVPYDFDMTGFVGAPHARPNPRFGLRSVRQRLYRGRCIHNAYVDESVQRFLDQREAIEQLIQDQAGISNGTRSSLLSYIKAFYRDVGSTGNRQRRISDKCL